jgi:hypothetical protein
MRYAQTRRYIDGAGFAGLSDQLGDELDIVFSELGCVVRPRPLETVARSHSGSALIG